MSHISEVDVEIKDLGCLSAAADLLGLNFMLDQKTYKWFGRSVGDYPLPEGMTVDELGKCVHALRVKDNDHAYEIGVIPARAGRPGYRLVWDFWNKGYGLQDIVGENCSKLKQEYAAQVAIKQARRQGMRVTRVVKEDGTIQLRGRV